MDTIALQSGVIILIAYLVGINLLTLIIFGVDKAKSGKTGARRISEKTLWLLALIGGSIGALAGMNLFRHKTKKLGFQAPLAIIITMQILIIWFFFGRP